MFGSVRDRRRRRGGQFGFCVWMVSIVDNVTEQFVTKQFVIRRSEEEDEEGWTVWFLCLECIDCK